MKPINDFTLLKKDNNQLVDSTENLINGRKGRNLTIKRSRYSVNEDNK